MLGEKVHLRALVTPYNLFAIVIYHKTYLEGLKWVQKDKAGKNLERLHVGDLKVN